MYTLNFKALLIKLVFVLFIRAMGIYLLMTLPALAALPVMYVMSAAYAISFGWIAGFLFLLLFYLLQKANRGIHIKQICLYAAIAVSVLVAFQMMEITKQQYNIWQSGICLLFPAAAVVSGWISTAVSPKKINALLNYSNAKNNQHY
ncbi:MAG: hypothetical protein ABJB86_06645 [Bacteroidota bacterium]